MASVTFTELAEIIRRELGGEADRVLLVICRECAGENLYIPRRAVRPEIQPSDTPQAVATRHGVSRRTSYRWVTAWKR